MGKITSFTDLIAWQEANRFAVFIYSLSKGFPKEEKFSLTDQLRRAAVSVSSNIAEGFARNSRKDKLQFYTIAKGSLFEVHSQSLLAKELKYFSESDFKKILEHIELVSKLLIGLFNSARDKKK